MGAEVLSGGAPMKRIIIPDAENYLTAIQDELGRTRDIHYFHRLEVLRYVLKGHNPYEAARVFNHSPRSIHNWLHRLQDQGLCGLKDELRSGRPARLSQAELEQVHQDLLHSPRELGYDQNLWDGVLLSHHLSHKYSVQLKVRRCQSLFHELGLSLQRPRPQAIEADLTKQEAFKKIWSANTRPQSSVMVRRRSSFPASH
jgi:transposase